jgi:uncharacterized damage-inducible protein DinB
MNEDRDAPRTIGDERLTLLDFLDYLREAVIRKAEGLTDDDARRAMVPSGTTLMGLVKHLTRAEVAWFQYSFAGLDIRVPKGELADGDDLATAIALYRQTALRNNEIVLTCENLSVASKRPIRTSDLMPLRWVLVHMIEETGRHAGHADILREQIDGTVGR